MIDAALPPGIRGFLLDMDGTLLVGGRPLPGATELMEAIRRRGASLLVLTNNSSDRVEAFHDRLLAAGLDISPKEILSSGEATSDHLLHRTPHRRILLLGTPPLEASFEEAGLELAGPGEDAPAVVVAFDKTLTYARLEHACHLLQAGADYFATHPDVTCITPDGLIPDTGAIIAAIETVTGRTPFVIGKPERPMIDAALARLGTSAAETVLVGDQLDTDMVMAHSSGLFSVLTLTGETSAARAQAADPPPDLIINSVADLVPLAASLGQV
jgi:HAD superfamily hydrolase (TIGR01450 family)